MLFPIRVATVIVILFACSNAGGQTPDPAASKAVDDRPLHMLVLGDSIMWGQGLRKQNKFWWRVKNWLHEKTGRDILEKIEAHSGAVIGTLAGQTEIFASDDGEVNLETPTVNQQLDEALKHYADPSKVDLILVNGCVNDVDVRNLLNASTSLESLGVEIGEKCGGRMRSLLGRIITAFPNAHVVVTSYYRIVSPLTANNSFTRLLVKKLNSNNPEARHMTDQQMRERLVTISEEWYRLSTSKLAQAVAAVNEDLQRTSSQQRILFAEIQFSPEHAFAAPDTLLWNFKFGSTNDSGLRRIMIILTLGTAAYKANDEVRESRSKSCKKTFGRSRDGRRETEQEKQHREIKYLACRYASLGHPNKMGALIYTEAIKGQLQWLITAVGWLRKPSATEPLPAN